VVFDDQEIAIAAAESSTTYRVLQPIYQSDDLRLHFGDLPSDGSKKRRAVFGIQTQLIGGPGGSLWARYFSDEPLLPIPVLLSNSNPDVWTVGLAAVAKEISSSRTLDFDARLKLRRDLAPYRDTFHRLFETATDADGLSLLCRLAGYTVDATFVPRLVSLLEHPEPMVQDSAEIGLGLMKDGRAVARIREVAARQPEESPNTIGHLNLISDAKNAMHVLGLTGSE